MQELIHCTQQDKEMFASMHNLVLDIHKGHSNIQIKEFMLNEIDNPTPYSKFMQVKMELASRYARLVDLHYDIRETEVKVKMKKREVETTADLEKELNEVQLERMQVELQNKHSAFEGLLDETRRIYEIYASMPEFHNLSEEEAYKLELEHWYAKSKVMPLEFEKRYGEGFLKRSLGEDYDRYKIIRHKLFGLLPQELCKISLIDSGGSY